MWLAIEKLKIEEKPLEVFSDIYKKERSMKEYLKKEMKLLKEELIQVKEQFHKESKCLKKELNQARKQIKVLREKKAERAENRNLIVQALIKNVNVNCKKFQSKISNHMRNISLSQSQAEEIKKDLIHADCAVETDEKKTEPELFQLQDNSAKDQLTNITKKESPHHEQQEENSSEQVEESKEENSSEQVEESKEENSSEQAEESKNEENEQIMINTDTESQNRTIGNSFCGPFWVIPSTSGISPNYAPAVAYTLMISTSVEDTTTTVTTSEINDVERERVESEEE